MTRDLQSGAFRASGWPPYLLHRAASHLIDDGELMPTWTIFALGFAFGVVLMFLADRTVLPWLAHLWANRRRAHGWR